MLETQVKITQLIQLMFKASSGARYLSELTDWINQSNTTQTLLNTVKKYSETLSSGEFSTKFVEDVIKQLGDSNREISAQNKAAAVTRLTEMLEAGQSREDMVYFVSNAIALIDSADSNWGALAQKVTQSRSLNELADSLVSNAFFQQTMYADALNNQEFARQFIDNSVANLATDANKTLAVEFVQSFLDQGNSRGDVFVWALEALGSIKEDDLNWGDVVKQFNNKNDISTLYAQALNGTATGIKILQRVTENIDNSLESVSKARALLTSDEFAGEVVDGYVRGATVFVDLNGNGVLDKGEPQTISDALGNFKFKGISGFGTIISIGGIDISTGKPFEGTLTAPSGSTVVNPLTTVINNLVADGLSVKQAMQAVIGVLSIDKGVDLLTFDPLEQATKSNASAKDSDNALDVQVAAVQVNTLVDQIALFIKELGISDVNKAHELTYQALAQILKSIAQQGNKLDLASKKIISGVVDKAEELAKAEESSTITVEKTKRLGEVKDGIEEAVFNFNKAIKEVKEAENSAKDVLVGVAKIQVFADDVKRKIEEEVKSKETPVIKDIILDTENLADRLNTDLSGISVGDVDGDGSGDAPTDIIPPVFTSGNASNIDENSGANQVVYRAIATDINPVSYSLKAVADANDFSIDSQTGEVRLIVNPDFEEKPNYKFTVIATDSFNNASEKALGFSLNNLDEDEDEDEEAPVITSSDTAAAINENTGAGQEVYTIVATDQSTVTYSLNATGDGALFSLGGANNDKVILTGSPDFETKPSYTFTVVATDSEGNASTKTVGLNILNLDEDAPVITSSDTAAAINENTGAGQEVYTIVATDQSTVTYSLNATGDGALFSLGGANNDKVILTGSPDFERKSNYTFTVVATDSLGNRATKEVSLPIIDVVDSIALADVEDNDYAGGFVINGASGNDNSGWSVSDAGDVNGDGFDDLIVGAPFRSENGLNSIGISYVVFGQSSGTEINLSAIENGSADVGFAIKAVANLGGQDDSGYSVSGAGDVNGDGFADLMVGAKDGDANGDVNSNSGTGYVIFGQSTEAIIELSALEQGSNASGFVINGAGSNDDTGFSVSNAGDVNGDGLDDVIVGSPLAGSFSQGSSHVVFGTTAGAVVELSAIENGTNNEGFVIKGVNNQDGSGYSVSNAGDVNGDGLDDLLVGAYRGGILNPSRANGGISYVIFGTTAGAVVELSALNADTGFVINGASGSDESGVSVSAAGDVNGDGLDDIIIGAHFDDPNGTESGASVVVFGQSAGGVIELSAIEQGSNVNGFVINGVSANDHSGFSVSGAGDVNGDGLDDLIVGAKNVDAVVADPNNVQSGASFVVFGKASGAAVELSAIENGSQSDGFVIKGENSNGHSGYSVSGAGDVNGDGFDDLIVGAPNHDNNSGDSYVVFGGQGHPAATNIGTAGNDTLQGDGLINHIVAGRGDDQLIGAGGADVLRGGAGNDVLAISDLSFASLDGGAGMDTLRLDASLLLGLSKIANNKIKSIEKIDLMQSGVDATVGLNILDLIHLNESSTLVIEGNVGDVVNLELAIKGVAGEWQHQSNSEHYEFHQLDGAGTSIRVVGVVTINAEVSVPLFEPIA